VVGVDRVTALTANARCRRRQRDRVGGGAPVKTALAGATEIASIGDEVCALLGDGSVRCADRAPGSGAVKKPAKPAPVRSRAVRR